MPVDNSTLIAIKDLAHELAPWAAAVIAGIGAWQARKGKEYSKKAVAEIVTTGAKADIAAVISQENKAKLEEVHKAVNGRMDQQLIATSEVARREGYDQGSADTIAMQRVVQGNGESGQG